MFSPIYLAFTKPVWSGWIKFGSIDSRRLAIAFAAILKSTFNNVIVIYLQRSPSRLKDEIWEPAVAFSWETNKQQTGRDKGWDKTKTQQRGSEMESKERRQKL